MTKRFLMILVMVSWCSVVSAEITVGKYLEMKKDNDPQVMNVIKGYVSGIGDGALWYYVVLHMEHGIKTKVYCVPDSLELNVENYISFLDEKIELVKKAGKFDPDAPIGMYIIHRLQEVFPCK